MAMQNFIFYTKKSIEEYTNNRAYETKIGETLDVITNALSWKKDIENTAADYILFGIPEDIGVIANNGKPGCNTLWQSFVSEFVNTQSNDFFDGTELLLLGYFNFDALKQLIEGNSINDYEKQIAYRHAVVTIDEQVSTLVKTIVQAGKMPIAIGGGHNNAYGMLRGSAKGLVKLDKINLPQINCINVDAHTDYRPLEGRHSGNGFRYAEEDGFLAKYCVLAIHENYLPQNVWLEIVNNPFVDFVSYEDLFINQKQTWQQAIQYAIQFTHETYTGIELDVDAIANTESSAISPTGITALQARQYINTMAKQQNIAYLHIAEGQHIHNQQTAKLVAYLVIDFVKQNLLAHEETIHKV